MSYWTANIDTPLPAGFDMETETISYGEDEDNSIVLIAHPHMPPHYYDEKDKQWHELQHTTHAYNGLVWHGYITNDEPTIN